MTPKSEKAVLFIDMLGFASLVNQYPVDIDELVGQDRLSGVFANALSEPKNRLTTAFHSFHYSLKWALELARLQHSVTAISFSDSAFMATDHVHEIAKVAIGLTQSMLRNGVPVRAGIAFGSFAAVRFKSDITLDSGEHAAHFLGQGVVGAHAAESCGVKGVRILVHPSALSSLDESVPILDLPKHEHEIRVGVQHEVDYWSFNVTDSKTAWHAIQDLWDQAPESAKNYYQATAEAVNRMRVAQGYESQANLRRRTLNRKKT